MQDYTKYINQTTIKRILAGKPSKTIREDYPSYLHIMTTAKGHKRTIIGSGAKTDKTISGRPEVTRPVYLAPHKSAGYGINTCKMVGACRHDCLVASGRMVYQTESRIARTRAFYGYPVDFLTDLINQIQIAALQAHLNGDILFMRPNGTSDIRWEKVLNLDLLVQDITGLGGFYDYTKFPLYARKPSKAYHLTYSADEHIHAEQRSIEYRKHGYPVTMVVENEDYKELKKNPAIIDGDKSDQRYHDDGIVILRAKSLRDEEFKGRKYSRKKGRGLVRTFQQVMRILEVTCGS